MKAVIKKIEFLEEREGKYGTEFNFKVQYHDRFAYYTSKKKEQSKFVKGQEAEFTEEKRTSKAGKEYFVIKPIYQKGFYNYAKDVKREQSKYSGFGDSYIKDMFVGGILVPEKTPEDEEHNDIVMITWKKRASEIFEHMVELDKSVTK